MRRICSWVMSPTTALMGGPSPLPSPRGRGRDWGSCDHQGAVLGADDVVGRRVEADHDALVRGHADAGGLDLLLDELGDVVAAAAHSLAEAEALLADGEAEQQLVAVLAQVLGENAHRRADKVGRHLERL